MKYLKLFEDYIGGHEEYLDWPKEVGKHRTTYRQGNKAVIVDDESVAWYEDGKLHREGAPAIVWKNGMQEWFHKGAHHREDGPAIIWPDGKEEFWISGERIESTAVNT